MKNKKGSVHYQIKRLFEESGIFQPGVSKHSVKLESRAKGIKSWKALGPEYAIYSYKTADAYLSTWHQFVGFLRHNCGLTSIQDINSKHVEFYLCTKIAQKVSLSTLQAHAAAIAKLQKALNMNSFRLGLNIVYDFEPVLDSVIKNAKGRLECKHAPRAYIDPAALIQAIEGAQYRLIAKLQYEGGARLREVSLVKNNQLRGETIDDLTGAVKGTLRLLHCKGGLQRDMSISLDAYSLLSVALSKSGGIFRINPEVYRRKLVKGCRTSFQIYHGSHGFRWAWAQRRYLACRDHGLSKDEALKKVSLEMGHRRKSITMHYLIPSTLELIKQGK